MHNGPPAAVAAPTGPGGVIAASSTPTDSVRTHIRGSSLLLSGRAVSLATNLAVQILAVRYLSKHDYGAFAYGLGVASMGSSLLLCGLDKTVSRFIPLYQERNEPRKALGTIALAVGTVAGLGITLVLLLHALRGALLGTAVRDPLALSILLVLIALAPLGAFDALGQNLLAVFASPRAIFFRRHLLGPGLKLAAVLLVIAAAGTVHLLAYGYVIGSVVGVAAYAGALFHILRKQEWIRQTALRTVQLPAREIFGFSLPLLSSDLIVILKGSLVLVLLEYLQTPTAVAEYRAVYPIALLNQVVFQNFSILFIPLASRMFARQDHAGMNRLYWQTALWITVLTFPIFAVTFSLARPLTILLLGAKYASSAPLLAILALGFFFHAVTGFNALTLRVCGRVRYIVAVDVFTAAVSVGASLLLIPRYGALGAAVGVACVLILHNLLNHVGLLVGKTGVQLLDRRYLQVYLVITGASLGLLLTEWLLDPPAAIGLGLAAMMSVLVIRFTRGVVRPEETFPELLRVPLLGRLLR